MEWCERFRFSVPAVPLRRGFLCVSAPFNTKGRFRFRVRFLRKRFRRFRFRVRFLRHPVKFLKTIITITFLKSLAELLLEKCNSFWGKPSDYNYISEFQEELILQKVRLQLHFLVCQELSSLPTENCSGTCLGNSLLTLA